MSRRTKKQPPVDELLAAIAKEKLGIDTLETRKSDSLDFRDVAVWSVRDALLAAYQAGMASVLGEARMKTLGTTTTYVGSEHSYLRDHRVRIVAVLKADGSFIRDEQELAHAGGVTAGDRVEVQPWLEAEGRFSFVTSDPRAIDLACFASLKR